MRSLFIFLIFSIFNQAFARVGEWGEPIQITEFPFLHLGDTSATTVSRVDRYDCAPSLPETGGEVLYRVQINQSGTLSIQVTGDNGQVDIDIQLLNRVELAGTEAQGCIDRNNLSLEQSVSPGEYYITVDTYNGFAQAGEYLLLVQFEPEGEWYSRPVAQGVTLETKRYDQLFGGNQFGSVIKVDLNTPGVEVKPVRATGCQTTSQLARSVGAVAAINGGYFDGSCGSVSLLKIDGQLYSRNARSRSAFGITPQGTPMISWIAAGTDWPEAYHAIGGLSRLARNNMVDVEWERDSADYGFTYYRNPRTGVALNENNEVIMATLDGRTSAGLGASLFDFGQWLVWLGAREALNLDGGGSTTLWTTNEGVINYPSDNGYADHYGERGVSNILAVFAPPLNREVEWIVNQEDQMINAGAQAQFDLFARDPDGKALSFEAISSGRGSVEIEERGDGSLIVYYQSPQNDLTFVDIFVTAFAAGQVDGQYQFSLNIIGGQAQPGGEEMGGNENEAGDQMNAGSPYEAGAEVNAGSPYEAGEQMNAGSPYNGGTEMNAGSPYNGGTEMNAGSPYNGGTEMNAGSPYNGGTEMNAGNPYNGGTEMNAGNNPPNPMNGGNNSNQMGAGTESMDPSSGTDQVLPLPMNSKQGSSCQQSQSFGHSLYLILALLFVFIAYSKRYRFQYLE